MVLWIVKCLARISLIDLMIYYAKNAAIKNEHVADTNAGEIAALKSTTFVH